jgi:hypothetical protein
MPTIVSQRRRPLINAATRSPGPKPFASQNISLASTSSGRAGSTHRPFRRKRSFNAGRPESGSEISRPVAGSDMPGTSSVTSATTRVMTRSTPGMAASRVSMLDGARLSDANTSAKRAVSKYSARVRCSESKFDR